MLSRSDAFDIKGIIGMAAARGSGGKKLGTVKIVDEGYKTDLEDVLELGNHVQHVEYGHDDSVFDGEW